MQCSPLSFEPDYRRVLKVLAKEPVDFIPFYEHNVSIPVVEELTGKPIQDLLQGDMQDKLNYFQVLTDFYLSMGYDCIPFSGSILPFIQNGEGLMGRNGPMINSEYDVDSFPWHGITQSFMDTYRSSFKALEASLPPGMKVIGGIGYGIFEAVQDFVPLTHLAYLEMDEPKVFKDLWCKVGQLFCSIWDQLLKEFGDMFAVCRIGDDMGFKTSLLMKPATFHEHIKPQYVHMVKLIHAYHKPFLLHSCGSIWDIMDSLIDEVGIDAKHSNEDEIAPFETWVKRYSDRIALFGGVDLNILCLQDEKNIKAYVYDLLNVCKQYGQVIAFGSGNQIADYVPPENYLAMIQAARSWRDG